MISKPPNITRYHFLPWDELIAMTERCLGVERCPLCRRELDSTAEKHMLITKHNNGKPVERLHKICHRKLHELFSEKELEKRYNNVEALLSREDVQNFVEWLQDKPPSFYDVPKETKRRKKPRQR